MTWLEKAFYSQLLLSDTYAYRLRKSETLETPDNVCDI